MVCLWDSAVTVLLIIVRLWESSHIRRCCSWHRFVMWIYCQICLSCYACTLQHEILVAPCIAWNEQSFVSWEESRRADSFAQLIHLPRAALLSQHFLSPERMQFNLQLCLDDFQKCTTNFLSSCSIKAFNPQRRTAFHAKRKFSLIISFWISAHLYLSLVQRQKENYAAPLNRVQWADGDVGILSGQTLTLDSLYKSDNPDPVHPNALLCTSISQARLICRMGKSQEFI